ncbi:hypothetical protein ACN6A1_24955 [Myxococcus virescens]|uniref:hypothetical protein n=1 Tax=Myxococcus virescens TaxID=83456 RepID=UPI003DA5829A
MTRLVAGGRSEEAVDAVETALAWPGAGDTGWLHQQRCGGPGPSGRPGRGHGPRLCNDASYEDPRSIAVKGQYAREKNLGGGLIWPHSQGHFLQPTNGHRDPLMDAVKHAFLAP